MRFIYPCLVCLDIGGDCYKCNSLSIKKKPCFIVGLFTLYAIGDFKGFHYSHNPRLLADCGTVILSIGNVLPGGVLVRKTPQVWTWNPLLFVPHPVVLLKQVQAVFEAPICDFIVFHVPQGINGTFLPRKRRLT